MTFTNGNTLVADDGFEALFEVRDCDDHSYNITDGAVLNGTVVRLAVDRPVEDNDELFVNYLSLPGDQDWLTNEAGIGILSFLDFPVNTSQDSSKPLDLAGGSCKTASIASRVIPLFLVLMTICIVALVRRQKMRI